MSGRALLMQVLMRAGIDAQSEHCDEDARRQFSTTFCSISLVAREREAQGQASGASQVRAAPQLMR